MKQILLAINGDIPTKTVFQYSVDLCNRIRAELNILQFIKSGSLTRRLTDTHKKVGRLGKFLEDSFAGVAFAEAGSFSMADEMLSGVSDPLRELIKNSQTRVPFKVAFSHESLETELSSYIDQHQDIVLTIFDPATDIRKHPQKYLATMAQIKKKLCIPLVTVNSL